MSINKLLKVLSLSCLTLFLFTSLNAQEEQSDDLEGQYDVLMKKSTTYQDYKVIKVVGINQLWENVNDSIRQLESNIIALKSEVKNLKLELQTTKDSLLTTQNALDESNYERDRISFLGAPLLKITYNSIVWGIILILAALCVILFLRFMKSYAVTKSTRKDYHVLEEEFENFKKNTRENEINLKRDLQTAVNTIEDLKR